MGKSSKAMISKRATALYGMLFGALFGGLGGGLIVIIPLIFFTSSLSEAAALCLLAALVGASVGVIAGLVAGSISRVAGGNKKDVFDAIIEGSLCAAVSAGFGVALSAWFEPTYAVTVTVLLGPAVIFVRKVRIVYEEVFTHKSISGLVPIYRAVFGFVVGLIFGFLGALLVSLIVIVVLIFLPLVITLDAIIELTCSVGPVVGCFTGAGASVSSTITHAGTRRAIYYAIEASAVAGMAASVGTALAWVGPVILGIGVATGIITLWSVTRGKYIPSG